MIDAVIGNLIKFMISLKILPALITLLNILEDTHVHGDTYCIRTYTGWSKKKKKNQCREILHKSIKADKAPSISPMTLPRAREHALRD